MGKGGGSAAECVNKNYIHQCGSEKFDLADNRRSMAEMGFTSEEFEKIINFYLFHAPVLKSNSIKSEFGTVNLRSFGWMSGSDLQRLEKELIKGANLNSLIFLKSDSIEETLCNMDLSEKICAEHPRAVLLQNRSVKVCEDGSVQMKLTETRMECLFRHIRNSIAHGQTYCFPSGTILLEDYDEIRKRTTARILLPQYSLLEWIKIIKKET